MNNWVPGGGFDEFETKVNNMKIIVDEMPKEPNDCLLYSLCHIYQELKCDTCKCPYLKPITDFHAEKVVKKYDDGRITAECYNIK